MFFLRLSWLSVHYATVRQSLVALIAWCVPSDHFSSSQQSMLLLPPVWVRSFPSPLSFTSFLPEHLKRCDHLTRQVYFTKRLLYLFIWLQELHKFCSCFFKGNGMIVVKIMVLCYPQSAGWSVTRYSKWLDEHPEERERLQLVKGALEAYVAKVRAKNLTQFAVVYPTMLSLLEKGIAFHTSTSRS